MAAIITAIIAATLAYTLRSGDYLVLRNGDTNAEYARFRVKEGDEFSVTFIHSVNSVISRMFYKMNTSSIIARKLTELGYEVEFVLDEAPEL